MFISSKYPVYTYMRLKLINEIIDTREGQTKHLTKQAQQTI